MAKLDDTDRQLLILLQEDDRQPLAALSEKIGVAVSTINDRIKRLIRSGVIQASTPASRRKPWGSICSPSSW